MSNGTLLVTCYVELLYSKIAHHLGMSSVAHFLKSTICYKTRYMDLLDLVLQHNYFVFDNTFYRHISGIAMGVRCAPSYANLILGWWEEVHVYQTNILRKSLEMALIHCLKTNGRDLT